MAKKEHVPRELAPREDQILQALYRLRRASVAEVRAELSDPPSYSAVRTMLGQLERKGHIRRDRSDVTHVYEPVKSRKTAGITAFRRLIGTFFSNSHGDALAALIDDSAKNLSEDDIQRLEAAIQRARAGE